MRGSYSSAATASTRTVICFHAYVAAPRVTLFKASSCHLCEDAKAELLRLAEELGFELQEIEIDGVRELEQRYRERIPVVAIDGEEVATYYVFPGPFARAFAAAQSRVDPATS